NRAGNEAVLGAGELSVVGDDASAGVRVIVETRPGRRSMEPKMAPGFSGATKRARPVVSVLSRSPLEKVIVAPGVSRPLTPSTASVARSPETMRRGKSRIRAAEGAGAAGARAGDFC